MELQLGQLAATKQTWRHTTVRELVADLIAQKPGASDDRLRAAFKAAVRADDDYFDAVTDYAFDAALRAIRTQKHTPPVTADEKAKRARVKAREAASHAKAVAYVKEQIILLNQELPNGKRARFCTLDYLYSLGGAYRAAGKKGSTKLVGQEYSEAQYRAKLSGVV
jgi:hypothetical protein